MTMAWLPLLKLSAQVTIFLSLLTSTSLTDGSNSDANTTMGALSDGSSTSSTTASSISSDTTSVDHDNAGNKTQLYLGGFFSLGGGLDNTGIVPATDMAFDHVNERADLLADYELKMIWNDTQVKLQTL